MQFPFRHQRPWLIPFRPREQIELSPEDTLFQTTIREQSAQRRALLAAAKRPMYMPTFERFFELLKGRSDCGTPTGSPIDE